jgi:hypothetical protein
VEAGGGTERAASRRLAALHENNAAPVLYDPIPGHEDWQIALFFVQQQGTPVIAELRIRSTAESVPTGGLTTRELREIRLDAVARSLRRRPLGSLLNPGIDIEAERNNDPRPGRRGRPDQHYAAWAAQYHEHALRSSRPVATLAEETGVSTARVRDHIRQARNRGLLSPAPPGRSGGELTDYALQLLRSPNASPKT